MSNVTLSQIAAAAAREFGIKDRRAWRRGLDRPPAAGSRQHAGNGRRAQGCGLQHADRCEPKLPAGGRPAGRDRGPAAGGSLPELARAVALYLVLRHTAAPLGAARTQLGFASDAEARRATAEIEQRLAQERQQAAGSRQQDAGGTGLEPLLPCCNLSAAFNLPRGVHYPLPAAACPLLPAACCPLPDLVERIEQAIDALHEQRCGAGAALADVVVLAAEAFATTPAELRGSSRLSGVVIARQAAAWVARRHLGCGLAAIGRAINRDHSTVIAGLTRFAARLAADEATRGQVAAITAQLDRLQALGPALAGDRGQAAAHGDRRQPRSAAPSTNPANLSPAETCR